MSVDKEIGSMQERRESVELRLRRSKTEYLPPVGENGSICM